MEDEAFVVSGVVVPEWVAVVLFGAVPGGVVVPAPGAIAVVGTIVAPLADTITVVAWVVAGG